MDSLFERASLLRSILSIDKSIYVESGRLIVRQTPASRLKDRLCEPVSVDLILNLTDLIEGNVNEPKDSL